MQKIEYKHFSVQQKELYDLQMQNNDLYRPSYGYKTEFEGKGYHIITERPKGGSLQISKDTFGQRNEKQPKKMQPFSLTLQRFSRKQTPERSTDRLSSEYGGQRTQRFRAVDFRKQLPRPASVFNEKETLDQFYLTHEFKSTQQSFRKAPKTDRCTTQTRSTRSVSNL